MPMNRLVRISALALIVAALPVLSGCGANPFKPPVDKNHIPATVPQNDTPQNTMLRFKAAYQYQDITVYKSLLSADFRYTFSAQTDPALVTLYGNNWGKDDEVESAQHLLTGFTNSQGTYVAPASSITLSFATDQYLPDPTHSDSAAYYDYTPIANVSLDIDVPTTSGTTTYNIRAQHNFYLVRGDAAFLDAGQPADANHWYIHRWDDLWAPLAGAIQIASVNSKISGSSSGAGIGVPTTWGQMKSRFR